MNKYTELARFAINNDELYYSVKKYGDTNIIALSATEDGKSCILCNIDYHSAWVLFDIFGSKIKGNINEQL